MKIEISPIGRVTEVDPPPAENERFTGRRERIRILPELQEGLTGLQTGKPIQILFYFHLARDFTTITFSGHQQKMTGVFNTHSPHRPNRIGVTTVTLLAIEDGELIVDGADMLPDTPIIDIKPGY